eukprot:CAMPEP_0206235070 /NCGR_PEP_ID=MMETSP0047_2-20121206/12944_1 /ASSEMBLY_ACC=CAM_ASM_000192 /TAXON_ID=195065 /ORGANISM="Chroomonas mesostigmatica_cf, Strain CCMP1168" /LENGTH=373 /DNA_ID=CAMNT_0053659231 /DNA_START=32 /DNA_END=1153 /DNA_ORIENTATION=+
MVTQSRGVLGCRICAASAALVAALLLQGAEGFQISASLAGSRLAIRPPAAMSPRGGLPVARGARGVGGGVPGALVQRPRRGDGRSALAPSMMSGGSAGRVAKIALDSVLKSGGADDGRGLAPPALDAAREGVAVVRARAEGPRADDGLADHNVPLPPGAGDARDHHGQDAAAQGHHPVDVLRAARRHDDPLVVSSSEGLSTVVVPGAGLPRVGVQLLMTSLFYTPLYCLLFVVTSAIWDGLGLKGIVEKVKTEGKTLIIGTVPTWTVINVFLFIWVSRTYRVLIAELFHYVYLIGLALWELSIIKAKKGEDTDTILEVLEGDAKKGDEPLVHPTPEGGVIFAPSQAGPSPEGAVVLPDGVVLASRQDGLDPRA